MVLPISEPLWGSTPQGLEPGSWRMAPGLLQQMKSLALQGDVVGFNAVAASCGAAMQWLAAVRLSAELRVVSLPWSDVTHGALIAACAGRWRMAVQCLSDVPHRWLTSATLGAAVSACSSGICWAEAWNLLFQDADLALKNFDRWYPSLEAVVLASCAAGCHEATRHQLTLARSQFLRALKEMEGISTIWKEPWSVPSAVLWQTHFY